MNKFIPITDDELISAVDDWIQYRGAHIGNAAQLKKHYIKEREARIRLADKAAEWAYSRRSTTGAT